MQVAINGVFSTPFKVTCRVRQGDPLSCPLFDLAIEPLTCKLRNDPEIHGLAIPGLDEKLTVNMFTDDTTLYLSDKDRFDKIEPILDEWCEASGAKFNIEKTEIIPIGTEDHRCTIVPTCKINPLDQSQLNNHIHITKDGEAVRSLGAWIGNNMNDLTPWEMMLDRIRKKLEQWSRTHPTLYGK